MNQLNHVLVDPSDYLSIINTKKAVFKAVPDNYNVKSRVYYDPSVVTDTDDLNINNQILDFVADGLTFDEQVIKKKAAYTLPYSNKYVQEIFENKNVISEDLIIEKDKYKVRNENSIKLVEKMMERKKHQQQQQQQQLALTEETKTEKRTNVKFKPVNYFVEKKNLSLSDSNLNNSNKISDTNLSKSLDNDGVFLTEIQEDDIKKNDKNQESKFKKNSQNLKILDEIDWDDYLIDSLSENTARWIVMKRVTDTKQKQKLQTLVESKFGRYTRNVKDLELVEDSLTEFEKRKIKEEKERLKLEKALKEQKKLMNIIEEKEEVKTKDDDKTPLYRLPQGLKRIELENLRKPDSNFNKTARDLEIEPSRVLSPKNYVNRMEDKNLTQKSLLKTEDIYTNEILAGNSKQIFTHDKNRIYLENGKTFTKTYQTVYPEEFSAWLNGVDIESKENNLSKKRPIKGMKKWKKYPELIDNYKMNNPFEINENNNFWHLLPSVTPDTELRKVLKSNFTVAKIVQEWRHKWQTSNKWTLADIDQLINDMKNEEANVKFQAVVVCARAVERMQLLIDKLASYNKKYPIKNYRNDDLGEAFKSLYKQRSELSFGKKISLHKTTKQYLNDIIFSEKLFETVESLLFDLNFKVKLAAAISIFIILKKFIRPYVEKYQKTKDRAELVLRDALNAYSSIDKYTAALTLGNDGFADEIILDILLFNYYNSNEQYTKEQVTRCLSDLSSHNDLVEIKMEFYLNSEHARERILTCKLIPCLKRPLSKNAVDRLINLMWNDINQGVKKVAAQTLGRTGRGKEVHDEIYIRLQSKNLFDRIAALKTINYIGIMTQKMLGIYLKCFRDDCLTVRQLACISCQNLYEKDDKIVDVLVFMARFDPASKLKALAIRTLGLIGTYNENIRSALTWALQFEMDPLIRSEACHSIILLNSQKDQELIDILLERHLVEEETIVRSQIMDALIQLGYDPNRELPIVTKIKEDVKKLNDKNVIISKILEIEKQRDFEFEKKRLIWNEEDESFDAKKEANSSRGIKSRSSFESFGPFEINQVSKKLISKNDKKQSKESSFLSKLIKIEQLNKDLSLSLSSLNNDSKSSFEEYTNDNKKSINTPSLSSNRINTIVEERS